MTKKQYLKAILAELVYARKCKEAEVVQFQSITPPPDTPPKEDDPDS